MSAGSFACSWVCIKNVLSGKGLMLSKQKYHTGGRYHFRTMFQQEAEKIHGRNTDLLKKIPRGNDWNSSVGRPGA
ncbi:uncharacterized, partial [Tachysurus ichikawai]